MDNIMYRRGSDGTIYGVLNDFDLSSFRDAVGNVAWVRRTGTTPFMSIDLLRGLQDHYYRHDLESIFYVLLTVGSLYELLPSKASSSPDPFLPRHIFRSTLNDNDTGVVSWFRFKTLDILIDNKRTLLWDGARIHLTPSFECLRPWLDDMRLQFADGYSARMGHEVKVRKYETYKRKSEQPQKELSDIERDFLWLFRDCPPPSVQTTPPPPFDERTLGGTIRFHDFLESAWTVDYGPGDPLRYRYNGPEYVKDNDGL